MICYFSSSSTGGARKRQKSHLLVVLLAGFFFFFPLVYVFLPLCFPPGRLYAGILSLFGVLFRPCNSCYSFLFQHVRIVLFSQPFRSSISSNGSELLSFLLIPTFSLTFCFFYMACLVGFSYPVRFYSTSFLP